MYINAYANEIALNNWTPPPQVRINFTVVSSADHLFSKDKKEKKNTILINESKYVIKMFDSMIILYK